VQPPGFDHITADPPCPAPKLTVCREDGNGLPIGDRLGDRSGDRVVTASRSMHDMEAVLLTLPDALPCCAFEHDDDRGSSRPAWMASTSPEQRCSAALPRSRHQPFGQEPTTLAASTTSIRP